MSWRRHLYWKYVFPSMLATLLSIPSFSQCLQTYSWASWKNFNGRSATGTIPANGKQIGVTMSANYDFDQTDELYRFDENFTAFDGHQLIQKKDVPRTAWSIGEGGETKMCFSEPVANPVLLFASLGRPELSVTLQFSEPYVPLYDGGQMKFIDSYSLSGQEGNSIVMFPGTFTCLTIYSTTREFATDITWGLQPPLFPVTFIDSLACGSTTVTARGGTSYVWKGGDFPNQATNRFDSGGVYIVTASDKDGCKSVSSKKVRVIPDVAVLSSVKETICQGENYQGYTKSGVYIDTLRTYTNCDSIRTLDLTVLALPKVDLGGNRKVCAGDTISLSSPVTSGSSSQYLWSTGETKSTIRVSNSGAYQLKVTQGKCTALDSMSLTVGAVPVVSPQDTVCMEYPLVAGSPEPNVTYAWEPTRESTRTIRVEQEGTYQVTVTHPSGCEKVKTFTVVGLCNAQIFAPESFTPNGDNINDSFRIFLKGGDPVRLDIYNRWGGVVYSSGQGLPEWDGRFKGGDVCPSDAYVYVLRYIKKLDNSLNEYRGRLFLLR